MFKLPPFARSLFAAAVASSAALTVIPALAGDGNVSPTKGASESAEPLRTLALADDLALYGIRIADPLAIIQAAKIKKSIPTQPMKVKATSDSTAKPAAKDTGFDLSADALLTRAERMAGNDATLKGLIADARSTKSRGGTRGPAQGSSSVNARSVDTYKIQFLGQEEAIVLVSGDGDTDLDLFVYDEHGNVVCTDEDYSDQLICGWTPRYTGDFVIRITNPGRVHNEYEMAHN